MNSQKQSESELADIINQMSIEEMEDALVRLMSSEYWPVVVKYVNARVDAVKDALIGIDPQDMTRFARLQGFVSGLLDFVNAPYTVIATREQKKDEGVAEDSE